MHRPAVADLTNRRPKPLHRTLPMWAREAKGHGQVEWRIYAPHRFGGAVFMTIYGSADKTRDQVAAEIRAARRVIWGHTKIDLPEEDDTTKPKRGRAKSNQGQREGAAAEGQQPLREDQTAPEPGDVDPSPQVSPDDDVPWRIDDCTDSGEPRDPLTNAQCAVEARIGHGSSNELTPKPGMATQEQGSLF